MKNIFKKLTISKPNAVIPILIKQTPKPAKTPSINGFLAIFNKTCLKSTFCSSSLSKG
mgnify:CR=1 FL=1